MRIARIAAGEEGSSGKLIPGKRSAEFINGLRSLNLESLMDAGKR